MNKLYLVLLMLSHLLITNKTHAQTISITHAAPNPGYTAVCVNDSATFTAIAAVNGYTVGDTVTAYIDFGDGTTKTIKSLLYASTVQNVYFFEVHNYSTPGTYYVETIVVAPDGKRDTSLATTPFVVSTCDTLGGIVYYDDNSNCVYDVGETLLSNYPIEIQDAATPPKYYSTYTNSTGDYSLKVPTGIAYDVNVQGGSFILSCTPGGYTAVTAPSTALDFAITPTIDISNVDDTLMGNCVPTKQLLHTVEVELRGYVLGDTIEATIDFGDGTTVTENSPVGGTNPQMASFFFTHNYMTPGTYQVQTIVTAPNGLADTTLSNPIVVNACDNLSGKFYIDKNGDCLYNLGDSVLNNVTVVVHELTTTNYNYVNTDANGDYSIALPVGPTYDVYLLNTTYSANSCPLGGYSAVSTPSTGNDFGLQQSLEITVAEPDTFSRALCLNNAYAGFTISAFLTGYCEWDTVEAEFYWGDGTSTTNTIGLMGDSSIFTPTMTEYHTYITPGTYYVQTILITPGGLRDTLISTIPIVVSTCGNLSGNVYMDNNNDCIYNSGDAKMQQQIVKITDPGTSVDYYAVTDANGDYEIDLPIAGTYNVNAQHLYLSSGCPLGGHTGVSVPSTGIDLGMQCPAGFDLFGSIWGVGFRPGLTRKFTARPFNWTCAPTSGTLKIVLSDPRISYSSLVTYSPAPTVSGDTLSWNFSNLNHTNSWAVASLFQFNVLTATNASVGDTICMEMIVEPSAGDTDPSNNVQTFCFRVFNSYDPNIKTGTLGSGPTNIIAPETRLDYTVHFQNTGNDVAYDVFIMDTLDANLDVSTLFVEGASHDMTYEIFEGNVLRFNFKNINLPDSNSNEPMSHGQVSYSIAHNSGLPLGSIIENTAHIYFDFNEAIVTNTTLHTIDVIEIVNGISDVEKSSKLAYVYPNPAKSILTIQLLNDDRTEMTIRTLTGESIAVQQLSQGVNTIDLSGVTSGIYILEMNTGKSFQIEKIIVQH